MKSITTTPQHFSNNWPWPNFGWVMDQKLLSGLTACDLHLWPCHCHIKSQNALQKLTAINSQWHMWASTTRKELLFHTPFCLIASWSQWAQGLPQTLGWVAKVGSVWTAALRQVRFWGLCYFWQDFLASSLKTTTFSAYLPTLLLDIQRYPVCTIRIFPLSYPLTDLDQEIFCTAYLPCYL